MRLPCADCGINTTPRRGGYHDYMVHDQLWAAAGMGPRDGLLCVECIERRIGRPLNGADLKPGLKCNEPRPDGRDNPRLDAVKWEAWALNPNSRCDYGGCRTMVTDGANPGGLNFCSPEHNLIRRSR